MIAFVVRRAASAVPTLVGITFVSFLLLVLLPPDPGGGAATRGMSAETLRLVSRAAADDRPVIERYASWIGALARGDLGRSLRDGRPVARVVAEALPWTVLLNVCALAAIYGVAVPLGVAGARRPGGRFDRASGWTLLVLYSVPSFAAAVILQEIFAVRLQALPLHGAPLAGSAPAAWEYARHLILPAACLALSGWAFVARYTRAVVGATLGSDFLVMARAKGVPRARLFTHVAASAAVPFATLLAAILPGMIGGSVVVEEAFSWPGMGRLYFDAIEARDHPVVLALTLLSALLVVAGHLAAELASIFADPRIRARLQGGDRAV